MFRHIADPVKRAQAELDVLMSEVNAQTPALDAEGKPVITAPDVSGTPETGIEAAAANATQNPGTAAEVKQPAQSEDATYWRNRCEVVMGKLNSEVPRLSAENANLKRQLSALQAVRASAPAAELAEGDDYRSPHVSDEIRKSRSYAKMAKEFGTDYAETHFEGAALTAQQAVKNEIQPMQEREALTATDRLQAEISRLSPNWLTTNDDPKFIAWASGEKDRYSGTLVIELLNQAYASADAGRVATIFNDYNQMLTSTTNKADAGTSPSADALVTPAKRGSSAQTNADANQGRIWTETEVDKFYDDYSRGRYENRQKEAKEIEAEISAAYKEGRVKL